MELIIAGIFVLVVASLLIFRKKSEPQETVAEVPYKVETTTPTPVVAEVAPVVAEPTPVVAEVVAEVAPVVTEVVEAPVKKTRKPRTPKAQPAVKEKAPAKALFSCLLPLFAAKREEHTASRMGGG